MNTCTTPAVYLPGSSCNDCTALASRVEALEELLEGYQPTVIAKTDSVTGEKRFLSLMKEA